MLSPKQIRNRAHFFNERMVCGDCEVVINDCEPHSQHGEWFHPQNGCKHSEKYLHREEGSPLQSFKRKRIRRALRRGGKTARKYRP